MAKTVIGFRVSQGRGDGCYGKLYITFRPYVIRDVLDDLKQYAHRPDSVKHLGEKLTHIHSVSGGSKYLHIEDHDTCVTFSFQSNQDSPNAWYGVRCDIDRPGDGTLDMLKKLRKAYGQEFHLYSDPRQLIKAAMEHLAATPVWVTADSEWLWDKSFDIAKVLPEPAKEEVAA